MDAPFRSKLGGAPIQDAEAAGAAIGDANPAAHRLPQIWRLTVSYDGSDFHGWQVQPGLRTVQGELQRCICEVLGETVLPQGSGRTDAGVHADGQVVSLHLQAKIPAERLMRALNRKLPGSVRVLDAEAAADTFHARGNVAWKLYTYRVFARRVTGGDGERVCPPMLARTVWDCPWPLDQEAMACAAAHVVGTYDFASFAASDPERRVRDGRAKVVGAKGSDAEAGDAAIEDRERSTVRTVFSSAWTCEQDLLVYRIAGNGFLHHMVRNLVGTMVEAGAGRRSAASLPEVLAARSRGAAGMTAPPQGLFLSRVVYRGEPGSERFAESCA